MSTAATIARALGGKRLFDGYLCRCPVPTHGKGQGDREPSLLVKDGSIAVLLKCFAGCDSRDVLAAMRGRGLVDGQCGSPRRTITPQQDHHIAEHEPDTDALKIWTVAKPAVGTIVETYLRSRGLGEPPPSIRYSTSMHAGRVELPVMVAAVQRPDGMVIAVQSTLLTLTGKKAPTSTPRITTGALGQGAVRFAKAHDVLGLAEGAETALSAMRITGVPTWACLGGQRMHRVAVPDSVRDLYLFGDNDDAGHAAVERTAHQHRHRRVILRFPDERFKDWNDALQAEACEVPA